MSNRPGRSQADRASALALEMRTLVGKLKRKLRDQTGHEDFTSSQASVLLRLEADRFPMASAHHDLSCTNVDYVDACRCVPGKGRFDRVVTLVMDGDGNFGSVDGYRYGLQ